MGKTVFISGLWGGLNDMPEQCLVVLDTQQMGSNVAVDKVAGD
jgi:hypothetical protein